MGHVENILAALRDDWPALGDGWTWSKTGRLRVSSDNWRMTVRPESIVIRPAREMRGTETKVKVTVGKYPMLKMIVLTHTAGIEESLDRKFQEAQR